jgi:UDP-N-acetylmuramate: L-alanyl-gamma-D-glutamyl-meso-diaminopimelate ligase
MSALAALLCQAGENVSGSDVAFAPPAGPVLRETGVRCMTGYAAENLQPRPDLVVVGNAIRRDNAEAVEAERLGVPRLSMSETLRERFLSKRRPLVVAGTHGKTTTSAMCTTILRDAGCEPGWFIGGLPKGLPAAAGIGSTRRRLDRGRGPFVVEGDEYDAAYWRKQPKFLDYVGVTKDEVLIVTSVEHDHVDIYPDVASYEDAFLSLLDALSPGALLVCDAQDARLRELVDRIRPDRVHVAWYALEGDATGEVTPTWTGALAAALPVGAVTFDVFAGGVSCGRFSIRVPGRHNARNAVAAMAACVEGFGVSLAQVRASLASFEGVRRRQDLLGTPRGVHVYDDFAHHPTAVDETLRALRARHPKGALWAAFEPRSATACRALHQQAYARAFESADHVLFAPLGRTNVPVVEQLDLPRLAGELGPKARVMPSVAAIVEHLSDQARDGDCVALLSNGTFGGIQLTLLAALKGSEGSR